MGDDTKDDRIAVTMPEDLKRKIRIEAAKRDMSMAELAREILEEEFCAGNPTGARMMVTAD